MSISEGIVGSSTDHGLEEMRKRKMQVETESKGSKTRNKDREQARQEKKREILCQKRVTPTYSPIPAVTGFHI